MINWLYEDLFPERNIRIKKTNKQKKKKNNKKRNKKKTTKKHKFSRCYLYLCALIIITYLICRVATLNLFSLIEIYVNLTKIMIFEVSYLISKRLLPFQVLCWTDNTVKLIFESMDILKIISLLHKY